MFIIDQKPLLSILIPAYRYAEGVRRILTSLQPLPLEDCEVIVFDDSPDEEVMEVVLNWGVNGVKYQHNQPALGAADNWNALVEAAHGRFCLLMHHDEFPLGDAFVSRLLHALREDPDVDVLLLDCVLVGSRPGQIRRHLPTWLRSFVVKHTPQYLFRRNVVGPTSALVVRRSLYPRFDARLRWLIDVDALVRLLAVAQRLRVCPQLQIGSLLGRTDSITAKLGPSLRQVRREEQAYLRGIHHSAGAWLGRSPNEPLLHVLLRACESVCWIGMRIFTRIAALLLPHPAPQSTVCQALSAGTTLPPAQ